MKKSKKYSEVHLADFYAVSPVFKRYSQFYLWSENFSEYYSIKYCEIYLSKYFFVHIEKYIKKYFSKVFLLTLYNSANFLKFIDSGFFKYINYHFLFFFQNNCVFFCEDFHNEVEVFVEEYFQIYIQKNFEYDLLLCLVTCVNELVPKSFEVYLNNRLTFIYKKFLFIELNVKSFYNSISLLNVMNKKKNRHYSLKFVNYNKINFNFKVYKSLNRYENRLSVIKLNFLSFFLTYTIYNWGYFLITSYPKFFKQTFYYCLFNLSKTSLVLKYLPFNDNIIPFFKFYYFLFPEYSWCFYIFSKHVFNKVNFNTIEKNSSNYISDFQILISFNNKSNNIGVYRESNNIYFLSIQLIFMKFLSVVIICFFKSFEFNYNKKLNNINSRIRLINIFLK